MISTPIAIILSLLGAGIGYLVKHFIEKRKELLSEVNRERRELYQKFVNLTIEILKSTKSDNKYDLVGALGELFEFFKKYILYASPNVINRFSDYFQYLYYIDQNPTQKNTGVHFRKLTSIMIAMRKDLGLNNKGLGKDGIYIMRALISDFDEIIK